MRNRKQASSGFAYCKRSMPIYEYCRRQGIMPFFALNEKRGVKIKYENDFTIGLDGVPVCIADLTVTVDAAIRLVYNFKAGKGD